MSRRVGFGDGDGNDDGGGWGVWLAAAVAIAALALFALRFGGLDAAFTQIGALLADDAAAAPAPDAPGPPLAVLIPLGIAVATVAALAMRRRRRRREDAPIDDAAQGSALKRDRGAPPVEPVREARSLRAAPIIFLSIWLVFWSFAILVAVGVLLDEMREGIIGGHLFLLVWIGFAVIGWVVAGGLLLRLLRGR